MHVDSIDCSKVKSDILTAVYSYNYTGYKTAHSTKHGREQGIQSSCVEL